MNQQERISAFVSEIWSWYARHKRTLPWRDLTIKNDTQRAYMILVSEVMLQQTQVSRVQVIFKRFLEQFPTIQDLAKATNAQVILAWRGMGYNSRALRLRDAARAIVTGPRVSALRVQEKNAEPGTVSKRATFPKSMEELLSIPGIGPYTAAAIRNFAFGIPTACIDTNIRRILHRTFAGPENADGTWEKDDGYLLDLAEEILDYACETYDDQFFGLFVSSSPNNKKTNKRAAFAAAEWHAALMDFGSLVQTKRNPRFDVCPLTLNKIMVTTPSKFSSVANKIDQKKYTQNLEPGREVGGKHIPNRIFRGRVVEALRDHQQGLSPEVIGRHITVDWNSREHRVWLQGILEKLCKDSLITKKGKSYMLSS